MKRAIILSCSERKKLDVRPLPAIERYDGAAFVLLRRFLKAAGEQPEIYILSAKFGLISADEPIPHYEKKLRACEVERLKEKIAEQKSKICLRQSFFVNLGKLYLNAFGILADEFSDLTFAEGSSGKRLAMMHDWLWGEKSALRQTKIAMETNAKIKIRGVEIGLSKREIFDKLRGEIKTNREAENFQSWFVRVDDFRVSPKWLVSKLTDLPVGAFHSDEARRVLCQLGFEIHRV